MKIKPVSFLGKFQIEDVVGKELDRHAIARNLAVDTPQYTYKDYTLSYETKGENADCIQNPIQKEHLNNF